MMAGSEATVYLTLSDSGKSNNVPIEGAVVRWSVGHNAGWEITRIDKQSQARLNHFIQNLNTTQTVADNKKQRHPK